MPTNRITQNPKPFNLSRRDFLLGLCGACGLAVATTWGYRQLVMEETEISPEAEHQIPFYGLHQAGILTPAPAQALIVAFNVVNKTKPELMKTFQRLTERIQFLMAGGTPTPLDPKFPPADSGVMGAKVYPDSLTITVAVGSSLFDERFGLSNLKPKHLTEMPGFPNDQLDPHLCHGDLLLQFCANNAETNIHALRDIVKNLSDAIVLHWQRAGFQQPNKLTGKNRTSVRNMLGFKDGTANLDANKEKLMDRLLWVQPNSEEPAWATGGSYMVTRVIRNLVESWDRTPLQEQEQIMGRKKDTGAPLGMGKESDDPHYDRDPKGQRIPLDAHIRRANPRQSELGLIFRRGFNYSQGFNQAGQMDMGLLFVCFQRDLEKGFITVQNRLNGEPLEEYIKPIGGGYFFALPGVQKPGEYLGQSLFLS
jgi:deferrochelatase/peroxidase EfeB